MKKVRILFIEDHKLLRYNIVSMLKKKPDMNVVATLIAHGDTNKEIAQKLNLSLFTIKSHVHKILKN